VAIIMSARGLDCGERADFIGASCALDSRDGSVSVLVFDLRGERDNAYVARFDGVIAAA
jgi:hypothetical protein